MMNSVYYISPFGKIFLGIKNGALTSLEFEKSYRSSGRQSGLNEAQQSANVSTGGERDDKTAKNMLLWLEDFFAGKNPDSQHIPLAPEGSSFCIEVWNNLRKIPFGEYVTYGQIAQKISGKNWRHYCRAVGGAVGRNPLGLIIPCHRVVGSNGYIGGFAWGVGLKMELLKLEGVNISEFKIPKGCII